MSNIEKKLPQRFPFLLIDKIISIEPGKRVVVVKNITANEPYFIGHFPKKAIMPGVLITEAMAQAAILCFSDIYEYYYLTSIKLRLLNKARPGDQLRIEAVVLKMVSDAGIFKVSSFVEDKLIAKGELSIKAVHEIDDE